MKTTTHLYVSRKNVLTWLMALCMVASAVARVVFPGEKGTDDTLYLWSQILLPMTATALYALITILSGDEFFYKTAIPVWMMAIYSGLWISDNVQSRMMVWLFWIALVFFATMYTDITAGHRPKGIILLLPVAAAPLVFILYFCKQELMLGNYAALLPYADDLLMLLDPPWQWSRQRRFCPLACKRRLQQRIEYPRFLLLRRPLQHLQQQGCR